MTPECCSSAQSSVRCIERADRLSSDPQLDTLWSELAERSVGAVPLNTVRDHLTKAMLTVALERSNNNYSRAAELLGVTRQSVQYLVGRHEPRPRSVPEHRARARRHAPGGGSA